MTIAQRSRGSEPRRSATPASASMLPTSSISACMRAATPASTGKAVELMNARWKERNGAPSERLDEGVGAFTLADDAGVKVIDPAPALPSVSSDRFWSNSRSASRDAALIHGSRDHTRQVWRNLDFCAN